jgi:hypothetical protein
MSVTRSAHLVLDLTEVRREHLTERPDRDGASRDRAGERFGIFTRLDPGHFDRLPFRVSY